MSFFISSKNVPLGYVAPSFPSLFWPLGPKHKQFELSYLYYSHDIWVFTVYWGIIFFVIAYALVGAGLATNIIVRRSRKENLAAKANRRFSIKPILVLTLYLLMGVTQGFVSGAIIGLVLLIIYRAGLLTMSTWIPFCWGLAMILYHICSSYSTSLLLI